MVITSVNMPADALNLKDGISDITMSKLGNIVVIAGANGAGKSRILNRIKAAIQSKPTKNDIANQKSNINSWKTALARLPIVNPANASLIQNYKDNITNTEKYLERDSWVELNNPLNDTLQIVDFVPKHLNLQDPEALTPSSLLSNSNTFSQQLGTQNAHQFALSKIQKVQNNWWNATHQKSTADSNVITKAIEDYESLKNIISEFLKTDLERDIDGSATIFGFKLGQANLSDGQIVIIQFCLSVFAQAENLDKNSIIFMDEPENHLHPGALISTVDSIRKVAPNTQLWISTHSLSLLAHFPPENIWYVESGQIAYAGTTPQKVLKGLVGTEEEILKLESFISLPSQFAQTNYATECLMPPTTSSSTNDDQSKQLNKILNQMRTQNSPLKVLDYGAGQGRLVSSLYLATKGSQAFNTLFTYVAFDEYADSKDQCESNIKMAYGSCANQYYNEESLLKADHGSNSFDVVILCNVFHEIDPKNWNSMFSKSSLIFDSLKENGLVLLVEDHKIPKGELAHSKGFIVLDTAELRKLFKINTSDSSFTYDDFRNDNRLKAHLISKSCLNRIDNSSRLEALNELIHRAKAEIVKLRKSDVTYKNGIQHSFWVQQLANATLAISELT